MLLFNGWSVAGGMHAAYDNMPVALLTASTYEGFLWSAMKLTMVDEDMFISCDCNAVLPEGCQHHLDCC